MKIRTEEELLELVNQRKKIIGALIHQRRTQMGSPNKKGVHQPMSASRFGRKINLESTSVYALESGTVAPSLATLLALVWIIGMDPRSLLGEQGAVDLAETGLAS